jgi:hypothetical protein
MVHGSQFMVYGLWFMVRSKIDNEDEDDNEDDFSEGDEYDGAS